MGVELARAQIAWQLGKRYVQDQPLDWGCAPVRRPEPPRTQCAPARRRQRGGRIVIHETIVTVRNENGGDHIAPMGVREEQGVDRHQPVPSVRHASITSCASDAPW